MRVVVLDVYMVDPNDDSRVGFYGCANLWWLNEHGVLSWLIRFEVVEMLGLICNMFGFLICKFELTMGLCVDETQNGSLGFHHDFCQ